MQSYRRLRTQLALTVLVCAAPLQAQQFASSEHVFGSVLGNTITYRLPSRLAAEASLVAASVGQPRANPDETAIAGAQVRLACSAIATQIRAVVVEELIRKEKILVSNAEVEDEARSSLGPQRLQAAAEKQHAQELVMAQALSLVYDQGRDGDEVFASILAPAGYSLAIWRSYLVQGKDPSFRRRLSENAGAEPVLPRVVATDNIRSLLERRKLDQAVDRELARDDPQFRTYLSEMQASQALHPDHSSFTMSASHFRYLKERRDAWWKARYSEVDLLVSDADKAKQCQIAALGLQVRYQN